MSNTPQFPFSPSSLLHTCFETALSIYRPDHLGFIMASSGSVYSQTLRDITNTKLDELAKQRASFETQRQELISISESTEDGLVKLDKLAKVLKAWFSISTSGGHGVRGGSSNTSLEIDLKNLDRFLAQARYDPSVSTKTLEQW